jgi:hypothetical protein
MPTVTNGHQKVLLDGATATACWRFFSFYYFTIHANPLDNLKDWRVNLAV